MTLYSGSELLGKERLSRLVAKEKKQPELKGRSRSERLLDESLKTIKGRLPQDSRISSAAYTVAQTIARRPQDPRAATGPILGGVPLKGTPAIGREGSSLKRPGAPVTARDTLILLVRRLSLKEKLPRTFELFERFFSKGDGSVLVEQWRFAVECSAMEPSKTPDAPGRSEWVIFWMLWNWSQSQLVKNSGDVRLTLLHLMEKHFQPPGGWSADSQESPAKKSWERPGIGSLSQMPMSQIPLTLYGMVGRRLLHMIWLPLVVTPYLYSDDFHSFHRSVDWLRQAVLELPESVGKELQAFYDQQEVHGQQEVCGQQEVRGQRQAGDPDMWKVPSESQLMFQYHRWVFEGLEKLYEMRRTPWGLADARLLIGDLYRNHLGRFVTVQREKIEAWQAALVSATHAPHKPAPAIVAPGQADRPVVDTRVEQVTALDGSGAWANRHLYT
ncbi:hypothetical protein GNI_103370 [Gregarina niphandrodes]|uniref:Uncharacterized protein n=1 Tax=Gregarina niphandrodes TaxID=110365 RepID=A0A023B4B7_GRENI|nr:hypothetical protein GNI_103370 [Gregarina niphandrodes]EZG56506.1 hypothetical protein GNI_103370 [Gregarina niphandrodes]|eukprot:XP_011131245.1 hypothetical protein GNI_103370 [Gregarina niphandrodes]